MSTRPSRSRSRSPRTRSYKIKMILPRTCEISAEETMSLVDTWGVQRIKLSDLTQESNGDQILKIVGPSQSVVFNAFTEVSITQCLQKFAFAQNEWAECRILVTETMASRLPKKKLEEVQDLSQASISLHPIVAGRKEVPLRVSGKLPAVESAFQVLLNTLDEQSEAEKSESPAAKFVVPKSTVAELTGAFQSSCKSEYGIDVFMSDSDGPPCSDLEAIVVRCKQTLKGKVAAFRPAVKAFIGRLGDIQDGAIPEDQLKMLVPSNQVRKLIGQGGNMIKDIQNKTGGANIKVVSEKNNERQLNTIVTIQGSKESKAEACRIIIEKLEAFKTGVSSPPRTDQPRDVSPRHRTSPRSQRISINVTVPDIHVCRLIGRKGETINNLKRKSGCKFEFEKQPCIEVMTSKNEPSRVCKLSGTIEEVQEGLKLLLDQVIQLESQQ